MATQAGLVPARGPPVCPLRGADSTGSRVSVWEKGWKAVWVGRFSSRVGKAAGGAELGCLKRVGVTQPAYRSIFAREKWPGWIYLFMYFPPHTLRRCRGGCSCRAGRQIPSHGKAGQKAEAAWGWLWCSTEVWEVEAFLNSSSSSRRVSLSKCQSVLATVQDVCNFPSLLQKTRHVGSAVVHERSGGGLVSRFLHQEQRLVWSV